MWRYLALGLQVGGRLCGMLANEPVYSVNRIARRVSHEAHKYKGYLINAAKKQVEFLPRCNLFQP
ncbi:MAG: hypothetical protein PHH91_04635 [Desulfuromonadaceae bacterium]|nr:hypothetical protein [Desulfuromonadaceae bacterium]